MRTPVTTGSNSRHPRKIWKGDCDTQTPRTTPRTMTRITALTTSRKTRKGNFRLIPLDWCALSLGICYFSLLFVICNLLFLAFGNCFGDWDESWTILVGLE